MYFDYVGSELNPTKSDGTIFLYLYIPYIYVYASKKFFEVTEKTEF